MSKFELLKLIILIEISFGGRDLCCSFFNSKLRHGNISASFADFLKHSCL